MLEIIAIIILAGSAIGILGILYAKIPVLAQLPQLRSKRSKENIVLRIEEKIKDFYSLFFNQKILHRLLSWLKIITLKAETRIDALLHNIRKNAKEHKINKKK